MAQNPVCVVTGVGPGTGKAVVKRFHEGGYQVAMLARTESRLDDFAKTFSGSRGFGCDLSNEGQVDETLAQISRDLGHPEVVVHNAVGGAFGDFLSIEPEVLNQNFQVNTMGLLYLARAVAPAMIKAGKGSIIVTGNTAAQRGKDFFAGFAPTKAAQRILAESMARTLGPKQVHVAYLIIDAVIDLAWTRKRFPDAADSFFITPDAIAKHIWMLAHQDPCAWSFLSEIRPYGENW